MYMHVHSLTIHTEYMYGHGQHTHIQEEFLKTIGYIKLKKAFNIQLQ